MAYTTLFFDLDDTLYASSNGLWQAIRDRMGQYMFERVGIPQEDVPAIRRHYYQTYGTTLRGLQKHHQVDADDYLAYVHDLPLERFLHPAPELRAMLLSLPQRRWIFTNADSVHASRVLERLELTGCFEGVIDVRAIQFACKPEIIAYQRALAIAQNPAPDECILLDDSTANLSAASQVGLTTVWVCQNGNREPGPHYTVRSLLELPTVLPELWSV
ncbi:MAG: pyrimidine 5'-nucleotidase [Anaerolineales bacterium]|nr:pyrimidine 5'-nucleotidase [Anaerolineales bacterium]